MSQKDWIQTFIGKKFFPLEPRREDFDIRDIAHALAYQCRFTGHCKKFYSVAEHSVRVSRRIEALTEPPKASYETSLLFTKWALVHDASEAYLCDVARPVKHAPEFEFYRAAERRLQAAIIAWLELPPIEPTLVSEVDTEILGTEARQLMDPVHPEWGLTTATGHLPAEWPGLTLGWTPARAEEIFLKRYERLFSVYP